MINIFKRKNEVIEGELNKWDGQFVASEEVWEKLEQELYIYKYENYKFNLVTIVEKLQEPQPIYNSYRSKLRKTNKGERITVEYGEAKSSKELALKNKYDEVVSCYFDLLSSNTNLIKGLREAYALANRQTEPTSNLYQDSIKQQRELLKKIEDLYATYAIAKKELEENV